MTRGRFITFEGGEGCGKSTQARLLAEWLRTQGLQVVLTREPGGTAGAEAIRELLLYPAHGDWSPRAEALLFAAARSDHVDKVILPALEQGIWVVSDRFLDSTLAYQGVAGELGSAAIKQLHRIGSQGLLPDRTFLLQVEPDISAARLHGRDGDAVDAIAGRDTSYHSAVAAAFSSLLIEEPDRLTAIDGNADIEAVQQSIRRAVAPLLAAASAF